MKAERIYLWGIGVAFVLIMVLNITTPEELSWKESYSKYKKSPYGAHVSHALLDDLFPEGDINISHRSLYELEMEGGPENLILLNGDLNLDDRDAEALMAMVHSGSNSFVASRYFYGHLADSLKVSSTGFFSMMDLDSARSTAFAFTGPLAQLDSVHFTRSAMSNFFTSYDTLRSQVLAVDEDEHPVLLRTRFGDGQFIFCSIPLAFTNYHLLNDEHRFAEVALSQLPVGPVVWDEYYKWGRLGNSSPLRFILTQPPLKWAMYICVLLALLFILFNLKRQQRPIPLLQPLGNTTRSFIQTVGRLYMQKGDNADLARKMSLYLKDEIRQHCYATNYEDKDLIGRMSERYNIPLEKVTALFARMEYVENAQHISPEELMEFSEIVEENKSILNNGRR